MGGRQRLQPARFVDIDHDLDGFAAGGRRRARQQRFHVVAVLPLQVDPHIRRSKRPAAGAHGEDALRRVEHSHFARREIIQLRAEADDEIDAARPGQDRNMARRAAAERRRARHRLPIDGDEARWRQLGRDENGTGRNLPAWRTPLRAGCAARGPGDRRDRRPSPRACPPPLDAYSAISRPSLADHASSQRSPPSMARKTGASMSSSSSRAS